MKKNLLYTCIAFLLLALPFLGLAQKDTTTHTDTSACRHKSIKGKIYLSAGYGQSTILWRIYGTFILGYDQHGISQSIVKNATADYGITKDMSVGVCIAYQTTSGVPQGITYNTGGAIETTTRLNLTARILRYVYCTHNIEIYYGLRFGISHWTDEVGTPPSNYDQYITGPALGYTDIVYPSFQVPVGIRFLEGPIGIHAEIGIGAPYFAEAGLTLKI